MPSLTRRERRKKLPLSYGQQRLWFIDQLEPGSPAYNMPLAVRLKGRVDADALEQCLRQIVRRHEVLRTRFVMEEGETVQVIEPEWGGRLQQVDLSGWEGSKQEQEQEVERRAGEEALAGFDLGHGPLLRAQLMKVGEQEHVLLLTLHHIVSDGWSMGLLLGELGKLYGRYAGEGGESKEGGAEGGEELSEPGVQYGDYAVWQREWLQGEVLEGQLRYWREQLEGMEVLELPTDRERPEVASRRGGCVRMRIGEEQTRKLRELGRGEGATLFMVLLGGLQVVLGLSLIHI